MLDKQNRETQQESPVKKQTADQMHNKREQFMTVLNWIAIILVIAAIYSLGRTGYEWYQVEQQKKELQVQIEELKKKNEQLEQENAQLQDPKAIEAVAREELGLVKPGEVPYVK
ncbi:cell division protein FtsL [uncultured Veillonella sp.]|uniref:cell division protein FtsL n=1 Tax=uncultured Veillonella sp. TaxID=159268 RepID=UPI002625A6A8|nr:cell division protein FtsL [uncultured Veillonella sp.]